VPVVWFGVFFGIGRTLASLLLAYSGKIRAITTIYSFYKFQLILYAILILILATVPTWWIVVIAFIVINAFQWGLSKVTNSYMMDIISSSKFKATLLSTRTQIENVVGAVASFGIGLAIEKLSYQSGFLYLGFAFLIILIPLYLHIIKQRKAGTYDRLLKFS